MKMHLMLAKWILVLSGLLWAYEGFTGSDLTETVFGSLEPIIDIVVFGGSAVLLGYHMLTMKPKK